MIKTIFITATNTDVGKTYATKLLIKNLSERGYKVGCIKPIETGVDPIPLDATALYETLILHNESFAKFTLDDICPYQFKLPAAPYVAKGHEPIEIEVIGQAIQKLSADVDILLIEGAGGVLVPVDENLFVLDIAQLFADKLFLITPSKLGSINDTLLNRYLLDSKNIEYVWAVNLHEDKEHFETITAPYYKDNGGYLLLEEDLDQIVDKLLA